MTTFILPEHQPCQADFLARIFIVDGQLEDVAARVHELHTEYNRSGEEWVTEHIRDISAKELLEMCDLPPDQSYELLIKGTIRGWWSGYESPEYEEEINITDVQHTVLPNAEEAAELMRDD